VTPESMKALFENFDRAIVQTLAASIKILSHSNLDNLVELASRHLRRVLTVSCQLAFQSRVRVIFDSSAP
jgi:hypothetical protein